MTNVIELRDYFAARAMQGYRASVYYSTQNDATIAAWAYKQADAMLEARGNVKQPDGLTPSATKA